MNKYMGLSLLLCLTLVVCGAAQDYPVVEFATPGTSFEDLPYASWLQEGSNNMDVAIEVGTLLAKDENGSVLMRVNAPVYRNQATGEIGPFGPLLRLKRGEDYTINLTNDLVKQPPGSEATQNKIGITNFHVHGIHESTGTVDRATASEYVGGDNIFVALEGKKDASSTGESLTLSGTLPEDHLPGNHWYVI
jgi:FtsP/CotA-like multicopper oxidase with cupredoxin domain